ncbi:collagen-binding domain-containing protein [Demequina sp.]|uniref:collagen-binding domain-containing protein n=1 Tax=Demequina sp. TaxID=2050685 RepID=UPI003D0E3077
MKTSSTDARPFAGGLIAAVAVLGTIAATTVLGSSAGAAETAVNPFDDAGGFSVYAIEDANLFNSEVEGALAVGGTLRAVSPGSRFPIVHYVAGTAAYTPPVVDGDATRLLIGAFSTNSGIVDVSGAGAPTGVAKGYAKIVNPVLQFTERGGYVQYRATSISGSESNGPVIEGKNHVWAADGVAKFTAQGDSVAEYVEQGVGANAVTQCLANPSASHTHQVTVTEDGGKAKLALAANKVNIVDYEDLFFWGNYASQIVYDGATRPSATSPVIVRVPAGTTTVRGSVFGNAGEFANYVMWDLSALSGAVTLTDRSGASTRIDGSVYAPNADLTAYFGPLDGQVIARNFTAPQGAGELHAYMFKGAVTCEIGGASESPSASPSATPSASTSASPSASVSPSTSPSASVSPSTSPSASPSTSPSASVSPSTSPSASVSPSTSPSASASPSVSASASPSASASASASPSASPSASVSPSTSPSASASASPTATASAAPTGAPSASPDPSSTVTETNGTGSGPGKAPGTGSGTGSGSGDGEDGEGSLSATGFDDIALGWIACAAVVAGAFLVGAARRRRV